MTTQKCSVCGRWYWAKTNPPTRVGDEILSPSNSKTDACMPCRLKMAKAEGFVEPCRPKKARKPSHSKGKKFKKGKKSK